MDKREIGGLGLSRRSVEQLERVIDTTDTVLYPARLMIGGWRMFFAAVLLAACGVCYGIWWICDSIYHVGVLHTTVDAYRNMAALVMSDLEAAGTNPHCGVGTGVPVWRPGAAVYA
jgi:hypothetical protein